MVVSIDSEAGLAMGVTLHEFSRVVDRASELRCQVPEGLSVIPELFDRATAASELRLRSETATLKALLRENGITLGTIGPADARLPFVQNNAHEWVGPTLFISFGYLTQHADVIAVALGVISNYVTEFFMGLGGEKKITLSIVVEQPDGTCKRLSYEGDAEGLSELAKTIREMSK